MMKVCSLLLLGLSSSVMGAKNIVELAMTDGNLSTLVDAVTQANLGDALSDANATLTVFAPTNDAFSTTPGVSTLLTEPWKKHLEMVLKYHVVEGNNTADTLSDEQTVTTLQGEDLTIAIDDDDGVMINMATVLQADLLATNGVVHVIDGILTPAFVGQTVVDVLAAKPEFSMLVELVTKANLTDAISGSGEFTILAPTNAAFDMVNASKLEALGMPENAADLEALLKYHMLPKIVVSSDIVDGKQAETKEGTKVQFSIVDGNVMIQEATVEQADLLANNGVVHGISAVLDIMAPTEESDDVPMDPSSDDESGSFGVSVMTAAMVAAVAMVV